VSPTEGGVNIQLSNIATSVGSTVNPISASTTAVIQHQRTQDPIIQLANYAGILGGGTQKLIGTFLRDYEGVASLVNDVNGTGATMTLSGGPSWTLLQNNAPLTTPVGYDGSLDLSQNRARGNFFIRALKGDTLGLDRLQTSSAVTNAKANINLSGEKFSL
jgi:hypothetical protein